MSPPKTCFYVLISSKKTCSYVLSPRFLPNLLKKPLFCATSMRAKDSLKHSLERQIHRFCTCESFKSTLLKPFPRFYIA